MLSKHLSRDSHGSLARALVTLNSKDLVVVASEAETSLGPGVEVSTGVDGSAGSFVAADGPVLLEGLAVTLDGRSTVASADSNVVDGSIDVDLTLLLSTGRGVVGAEVLDDVVLNERVAGPAVNSEVAVAVGAVVTRVLDGAEGMVSKSSIWTSL
ncbi:unnamed protein product [Fusarium graminearum]|nr:unnamed protein product [Fusarium graminearum]CAG1970338.1 unnamed protein product [Fusarium graminearum]VTO92734.1 unnamed protein product [Fusarium graminearum]